MPPSVGNWYQGVSELDIISVLWYPDLEINFPHLDLSVHSIPCQNPARHVISTHFCFRHILLSVINGYQGLSELDIISVLWYSCLEINFPHSDLSVHSIPCQNPARHAISTHFCFRHILHRVENWYQGLSEWDNISELWYPVLVLSFPHLHLSIHSIPCPCQKCYIHWFLSQTNTTHVRNKYWGLWELDNITWYSVSQSHLSILSVPCQNHARNPTSTDFCPRQTLPSVKYWSRGLSKLDNITALWYPCLEIGSPHLHLSIHSIPWQNHARNPTSTDFCPRQSLPSFRNKYWGLSDLDNITAMWYPFLEMNSPELCQKFYINWFLSQTNTTQWQTSILRVVRVG